MEKRLCDNCRKYVELDHFEIKTFKDGKRYFCKINIEKNKDTNGRKLPPKRGKPKPLDIENVNLKSKNTSLLHKFGINLDNYNEILKDQNYCCAICNKSISSSNKYFDVDHCHITGKVRGLLCVNCNAGIGLLKDDYNLISKAIEYLNSYII